MPAHTDCDHIWMDLFTKMHAANQAQAIRTQDMVEELDPTELAFSITWEKSSRAAVASPYCA